MATAQLKMHSEHQQWLGDEGMWRDDLAIWEKEIDQALAGMRLMEVALREHRQRLQARLDVIAAEERELTAHEHALAEAARGGPKDALAGMVEPHKDVAARHAKERKAHEALKKQHHTILAHWTLLHKALTQKA